MTAFWILVWEAVARFVARDNEAMYLLLPRPVTVFRKWLEIGLYMRFSGDTDALQNRVPRVQVLLPLPVLVLITDLSYQH